MRSSSTASRLSAAACAALMALPAWSADVTVTSRTTGGPQGEVTSVVSYTATKVRTVEGERETLVDLAGGRILSIDHGRKEYFERTFAEIEAQRKQMEDQIAAMMMQAQAGGMGGMMGMGGAPKVSAASAQTVNGIACQETTIETEMTSAAICVAAGVKLPFDASQMKKLDMLRPRMRMAGPMSAVTDAMAKVLESGFSVREKTSMNMMGNVRESVREVVKLEEGPVAEFRVEAPAGYRKSDPPQPQMRMRGPGI
jgi:hypothetical protein